MKTTPHQEDISTLTSPNMVKKAKTKENMTDDHEVMQHTAFGKACYDLTHSERVMDDLTFGRRVGLYELRGEIGSGNFSQVRFGIHDLTKGESLATMPFVYNSFSDCRLTQQTTGTKNHVLHVGGNVTEPKV